MQATVTEIGKHAIDDSEKMIILFGEGAWLFVFFFAS